MPGFSGRGMYLHTSTEGVLKNRDAGGRFISPEVSYRVMAQANERAAILMQDAVVTRIENRILRRATTTGRLVSATADPRNRYANRFGWGVGNVAYLDESIAKYWRQIEEGTSIHVGREIHGVWGGSIEGFYRNDWGVVPRGGSPITRHRRGGGQGKFIPIVPPDDNDEDEGPRRSMATATTIRNPISPMRAYAAAFQEGQSIMEGSLTAAVSALRSMADSVMSGFYDVT